MKLLILGGGGLGTVLAAYLSRAGAEVTLFVKPAQAAAFERVAGQGEGDSRVTLRIGGLSQLTATAQVASEPARLRRFDYLLVCVKARDMETALEPLRHLDVATVLSLQNGVKKDEILVSRFGAARMLGALTGVGGTLQRPGQALHTLAGATLVGELDGSPSERGELLAALFRAAGLPAACVSDILTREWHKLAAFLPGALLCSITRMDVATAMLDPDLARLRARLCHEIAAVAAAEGHPIGHLPVWITRSTTPRSGVSPVATLGQTEEEIVAEFAVQGEKIREQGVPLYPSMATDIMAGRPTELEDTAGDALERAARHGVPVPVMEACYRLVKGIEKANLSPQPPPLRGEGEP
jgi:2-dehydropantoate 2-reductase